ncbi:transcription factor HES-1-like isoform X1 [Lingula anatina]|nr:transcription factor HES-1-like isoform X1 [Lingula anatina]|eukprot:XP_013403236.1 transcription factor HES-1-like isoform X1 [Lingula anatina]
MEKRRRARINASLAELKALLLEVMKREGSRHSKMEKADILEMTVRHLRHIQRQQFAAVANSDPTVLNKYNAGFNECTSEVSRYLHSIEGVDPDIRARVLDHLATCVANATGVNSEGERSFTIPNVASIRPMPTPQTTVSPRASDVDGSGVANVETPSSFGSPQYAPTGHVMPDFTPGKGMVQSNACEVSRSTSAPAQTATVTPLSAQQSSSGNVAIGGLQVIPTRLPSGELAFVLPQNVINSASQVPAQSYILPVFAGNTGMASMTSTVQPSASITTTTALPLPAQAQSISSNAQSHQHVAMATLQSSQQPAAPIRIDTSSTQSAFLSAPSILSMNGLSGTVNLSPNFPSASGQAGSSVQPAGTQYQPALPSIIMLPSNYGSLQQPFQGITPNLPGLVKPGEPFHIPSLKEEDVWRPW